MTRNLKENLEKFIAHCQDLKDEDDPSGNGFTREFRDLREKQMKEKEENRFAAEEGKKSFNIKKNRYKDILPYDYRRVILKDDEEGEDYINASYIQGVNGENCYIASQGPLPHTVNDFIRMLWQLKIEIVFMACRLEEGEPKKKKCEKYWTDIGESKQFGDVTVTTEEESLPMKEFYRRKISLKCNGTTHKVIQFHYIGWPDHGIPDHPSFINIMINHMRVERQHRDIPLVIHCSAGCGRTGTICAIDYAWTLLNEGKIAKDFNLYDIICKFREQRQSMVQTPDQYELVHLVMENLFTEWIKNFELNNDVDTEQLYYNLNAGEEDADREEIYVNENMEDEGNEYVIGDDEPQTGPTSNFYNNVDISKSSQDSKKQNNGATATTRINSNSSTNSSMSENAPVDMMYALVDVQKKDMEKSPNVTAVKKQAEKADDSPRLPPRMYKEDEIKPSKVDVKSSKFEGISSRPPQPPPESQKPNLVPETFTGGGTVPRHEVKHSYQNVQPGTNILPQGQIRQVVSHQRQQTADGFVMVPQHRTVVQVPRRQYVPPAMQMKLKVGKEELVLPGPRPTRFVPPLKEREFRGQQIGFNNRPVRHPSGGSVPRHFNLNQRDYFFR